MTARAPRQSQVGGPPADWKRWLPLLDGKPVSAAWAFDAEAGWVEVWVELRGGLARPTGFCRRRLHGQVQPVELARMKGIDWRKDAVHVFSDDLWGEAVPGTEMRRT